MRIIDRKSDPPSNPAGPLYADDPHQLDTRQIDRRQVDEARPFLRAMCFGKSFTIVLSDEDHFIVVCGDGGKFVKRVHRTQPEIDL
jgi:hypothetical protein